MFQIDFNDYNNLSIDTHILLWERWYLVTENNVFFLEIQHVTSLKRLFDTFVPNLRHKQIYLSKNKL